MNSHSALNQEAHECENHSGQQALGGCAVCGKPLCGDCALTVGDSVLCDREHQRILADWTTVFTCDSEFEADALQRNLESAGIPTRVFSLREHVSFYWTHHHAAVRLMVYRKEADKALSAIEGLGLSDYAKNE